MNKYQKIVLILGAIGLIFAIWTTPTVQYAAYGLILKAGSRDVLANVLYVKGAIVRGIGVVVATALIYFVSEGLGRNVRPSK